MKTPGPEPSSPATQLISKKIASLGDWRGETLARMRKLIHDADPAVVEEWKWMGTPVWSHAGIVCTGESYKDKVKLTFAKGAALADPRHLFNSSLDGNTRRAIDIGEAQSVDAAAFKALVRAAVDHNVAGKAAKATPAKRPAASKAMPAKKAIPAKKPAPKKAAPKKPAAKKPAPKKPAAKKPAAKKPKP